MSKASKSIRSLKRKAAKRAKKEMNRQNYAALAAAGKNKKSKRFVLKSKRSTSISPTDHALGRCFNTGCKKCCDTTRHFFERKQEVIQVGMVKSQIAKKMKEAA